METVPNTTDASVLCAAQCTFSVMATTADCCAEEQRVERMRRGLMPLRARCSDGANRPDAEWKSESHWHKVSVRPGGDAVCPFPESREFGLGDNSSRNPGSAGAD